MVTCQTAITTDEDCTTAATVEIVDFFTDGELPEAYRFCDEHAPSKIAADHPVVAFSVIRHLEQG